MNAALAVDKNSEKGLALFTILYCLGLVYLFATPFILTYVAVFRSVALGEGKHALRYCFCSAHQLVHFPTISSHWHLHGKWCFFH